MTPPVRFARKGADGKFEPPFPIDPVELIHRTREDVCSVMIDVTPNRIRNSMYSLQPTIVILFSIPLMLLTSWLVPISRFLSAFMMLGLVTMCGALLIKRAFTYPIIKAEDIAPASKEEIEDIEEIEVT